MTITAPQPPSFDGLHQGIPARLPAPIEACSEPDFGGLEGLPHRELDKTELRALAASVAARPELWEEHVVSGTEERHYFSLHRDAHVDIWVLCWTPGDDTGWHDHDVSSGAVAVVRGALTEHNLAVDAPSLATDVPAGQVFSFGPDHIHRLTGKDAAVGVDPRVLTPALAVGPVRRGVDGNPAPDLGVLRRRAATTRRRVLTGSGAEHVPLLLG